jgi:two-component system, OmpR family, alkaline phosphatase synthesis response regulator PhoP
MCRILVVDDDSDFVEITRTILEKEGYQVVTASSGQQALTVLRREPAKVVLLDIMMDTALDGLNVSHEIQSDPSLKGVRVIMVTSIMDTAHAGLFPTDEYVPIDAWITKPVQPQALLKTIAKYCPPPKEG